MPDGKAVDPNIIPPSGESGRRNLPRGDDLTVDSMMHDRGRAEPNAASGFADAILELGVLEAFAVVQGHLLVSLEPCCLIPQTKLVEEAPGNSHVASEYVLTLPQYPLLTVVEQPCIRQGRLVKPLGPFSEIVRHRNDGTAGQDQRILAPSKQVEIGRDPMRLNAHVIVGEQQQGSPGHPNTGIFASAEAKARLARRSEPRVQPAPRFEKGRSVVCGSVVDHDDLEGSIAILRGQTL